jgi:Dienelactone hydrolase and related enzymes
MEFPRVGSIIAGERKHDMRLMKRKGRIAAVGFAFFTLLLSAAVLQAATVFNIVLDRGGVLLSGRLRVCEGDGPFPTVILLHGLPGNESDVLGLGAALVKNGINVLTFNYSGTFESQGEWSFADTLKDIEAAFYFVNRPDNILRFKIDARRLGLGGYDYGGGMVLAYAAGRPEVGVVFSIAGTDHGEFLREYARNPEMRKIVDETYAAMAAPAGPVRFAEGAVPREWADIGPAALDPNLDFLRIAPALAGKDILLVCAWDDETNKVERNALPLYRALKERKAKSASIAAFQDDHAFRKSRAGLARAVGDWLKSVFFPTV